MHNLTATHLSRTIVDDRIRDAERRRRYRAEKAHRVQRERVWASFLLRPQLRSAGER